MQSLAARAARPALVKPRPSKPSRRVSVLTPRASAPGGSGDEIEILEQAFAKAPVTKKLSTPALLACPICLTPFPAGSLRCARCARDAYPTKDGILDLCLDANGAAGAYAEPQRSGTRLFQSDVISAAYEKGWRRSFAWAGFPGEEEETEIAMTFLRGAGATTAPRATLLDVSCGSGLFSRRFAASGEFAHVVASDFSASMMRQTKAYCEADARLSNALRRKPVWEAGWEEEDAAARASASTSTSTSTTSTRLSFVRADVGRLPFATGSFDAVHAGAAMHCWPSPSAAVAEISRVLRPGGVFIASTFLDPTSMLGDALGSDEMVQPLSAAFRESGLGTGGAFNQFWSEKELRDLTTGMCGLERFERKRERQFIFFSVRKPGGRAA